MWPFSNPPPPQAAAAAQFMAGTGYSFAMDQYRGGAFQLGSIFTQPQPTQTLGLGMSDSNLGMLAAMNAAYARPGPNETAKANGDHTNNKAVEQSEQTQPQQSGLDEDDEDDDSNSSE
ncbi:PREDICTED: transcription factor TCP8-like [Tarenaya hassleriana]|uniref:transcription factor TCP8-like n=1 Tax=Tarenaya hassleriana TaxID=28532 RepID=UPI00053C2C43|nr:PREDICTED: transcription factor TCP8-like [Tarenaya hassleriana]